MADKKTPDKGGTKQHLDKALTGAVDGLIHDARIEEQRRVIKAAENILLMSIDSFPEYAKRAVFGKIEHNLEMYTRQLCDYNRELYSHHGSMGGITKPKIPTLKELLSTA